jgi:membrane protease YdiL (CAAX protease family)
MSEVSDIASRVLTNDEGELRSGWRALIFLFAFILVQMLLSNLTRVVGAGRMLETSESPEASISSLIYLALERVQLLASAAIASAFCARSLEHRSFASIGYKLHRRWLRDFALGCLIGAATLVIAVAVELGAGAVTFKVQARSAATVAFSLVVLFTYFVIAAAAEELLFRGFAFQAFIHNLGTSAAVVISSLVFGLAHLTNPNATVLSTANTVLAGIWLAVAYITTCSLWLPTALHCSWNLAMVFIFGLPVSGITDLSKLALMSGQAGSPMWLSGGGYGPEGGVAASLAMILSALVIGKSGLFAPDREMIAATKHGKPQTIPSITPGHDQQ